ncbi:WD repeat-containing protein on Y chromosome-like isoform X2 [Daktulosphaira vitifoliae]|uniref:WD repeat-containing protein on Y chromosome-like isoform X2 n=1 Tax=Daktulosphaira vitifoliae TaxID=58002 RepID=UPI0021A9C60E|nr:WD repeat-containing protein on Y chromosome-like isoform X2 [Daktulosphaira vitifoliae]
MEKRRSCSSKKCNNELTTKLTALVVLPDLNIVGVASVECELRFYDTLASQFRLRLVIDKMPHMVTCLSYIYEPGGNLREYSSKLLLGDCIGGVRILSMMTRGRGPFRMNTGDSYVVHNYADLMTLGGLGVSSKTTASAPFHVLEFPNLHPDYVQEVMFCNGGKAMVSVSETYNRSMMYCQTIKNGWWRSFTAPQGFSCACIIENTHLVAGSQDCVVRVWSIDSFLGTSATTKQRSINFTGHNAPIMHVFYNNRNRRLYSMCFERIIKVWSVHKGACLMTYTGLTTLNADYQELCIYFNQKNSTLIVGGRTIVVLPCSENINHTLSDGYSHNAAVTKTMYNKLYRLLISVSADAVITVWNPWTGEMILKRTNAHTKLVLGEFVPAEITAANFDPSGGLLVTGSEDGSIRMWDPTNGACLNRLQIASKCQISELIWLPNKVLVSSWDKRITEFNDPLLVSKGKRWLVSHEESILTMSVKLPSMLVTTSYAGKVGFWRLETGQMIKFYGLKMKPDSRGNLRGYGTNKNQISSMNLSSIQTQDSHFVKGTNSSGLFETRETTLQRLGVKFTPKEYHAATSSHFLRGRQDATRVGNLLIATRNGVIQIWSTFKIPTYLAQFKAIHIEGDYVTSMASDDKSHYLFTCFTTGYVKVWFIINFGVVNKQAISMPLLRLRFSFLINSFFVGRAERAARNEQNIILVSSYQAHLGCIRHIEYVQHVKMVVTSSVDMSIRLWTINGHYIGTLDYLPTLNVLHHQRHYKF